MIWRVLTLACAAGTALVIAGPASADSDICGSRETMLKGLLDRYGEVPKITAIMPSGQPIIITVSPSGSWTVLAANQGRLCALSAGVDWKEESASVNPLTDPKPVPQSLPTPALLPNGLLRI